MKEFLEGEIERLKQICYDIVDIINTSSDLIYEPLNYQKALREIEDLAISGYSEGAVEKTETSGDPS